jgi:GTP-binding protein EngB required for normal cell division
MTDTKKRDHKATPDKETPLSQPGVLHQYEQLKFELASLIRTARSYAADRNEDQLQRKYGSLLTKLAEDRFYLTVVGQSSRGKTTLINALLGMDRLPTGIVPITSVITSVGYGSKELVRIYSRGWSYGLDVPLAELPEYITEQRNPGNKRGIELAEIRIPAEILRRGFYLVDTPGFGSAIFENTWKTRNFLAQADAFVFVTSFDTPFSAEELQFFREAQSRSRKVFVVVNKLDLVSSEQREEVLTFLRQRLANECEEHRLEFFPLSARDALAAKLDRDSAKLEQSGLSALHLALVGFLADEKASQLLFQTCEALEELLASHFHPDIQATRRGLHEVRSKIADEWRCSVGVPSPEAASPGQSLRVGPCSICAAILKASFDFLSKYQYELWRSVEEQKAHAERHGFCAFHTWQYSQIASPQGICGACPTLLLSVADRLNVLSQGAGTLIELRQSIQDLGDSRQCRLCETSADAERRAIASFVSRVQGESDHMKKVWTLCFPHFVTVLQRITDSEVARRLARDMAQALEHAAENMQRYALKHEGLRRELASEEEVQAPELGLVLLAGHRKVIRPVTT